MFGACARPCSEPRREYVETRRYDFKERTRFDLPPLSLDVCVCFLVVGLALSLSEKPVGGVCTTRGHLGGTSSTRRTTVIFGPRSAIAAGRVQLVYKLDVVNSKRTRVVTR
ncbi:unnamed protein product [Laminaria digitata]